MIYSGHHCSLKIFDDWQWPLLSSEGIDDWQRPLLSTEWLAAIIAVHWSPKSRASEFNSMSIIINLMIYSDHCCHWSYLMIDRDHCCQLKVIIYSDHCCLLRYLMILVIIVVYWRLEIIAVYWRQLMTIYVLSVLGGNTQGSCLLLWKH